MGNHFPIETAVASKGKLSQQLCDLTIVFILGFIARGNKKLNLPVLFNRSHLKRTLTVESAVSSMRKIPRAVRPVVSSLLVQKASSGTQVGAVHTPVMMSQEQSAASITRTEGDSYLSL